MTKPRPKIMTTTQIGPDVDLEHEAIRLADGTHLTAAAAEQIVNELQRVGRPSLSGQAAKSPQIAFRVPTEIRDRAAEVAAREGKTVSQLAREALESRLAG